MKHYILKIDSFLNTFSIVEAGKKITFEYTSALNQELLCGISAGDKILGYDAVSNSAKMIFVVNKVESDKRITLSKELDISNGCTLSDEHVEMLADRDIVEISEEQFKALYAEMLKDLVDLKQNEDVKDMDKPKLKNCLDVQRNPRTNKMHPLNLIIYGAPGTGKTYSTAEYALAILENSIVDKAKKNDTERREVMKKYKEYIRKGQVVFTTFHQSYGYEEFIQGLRPDTDSSSMSFKTVDGIFKRIADEALNDAEKNYVIIIDEINRANISKVFGELITLIEEDKRWGEVNETCATLQSGDVFAVPNNLYIVGTMNSADKSISLIDAALRRRFDFVEQKPQPELVENAKMKEVLTKINSKLADELESSDLLIGHSYFMNKTEDELIPVLNNNIIPLLYEYFYDNKKKVANVLDYSVGNLEIEIVDDNLGRLSVMKT